MKTDIKFARFSEVAPAEIAAHMSDPRVAEHMPLSSMTWDTEVARQFVASKEKRWARDGLGHWAFLLEGHYIGWGGFQKEVDEWDFGLVLRHDAFGLGLRIAKKAIEFAVADDRIPFVTFLLPPSRENLGALRRLGAKQIGQTKYAGATFLKYWLETR